MLKKLLAVLLSVLLLISLVPAAVAVGDDLAAEPYDGGEAAELAEQEPGEIVYIDAEPEEDDGVERTPGGSIVVPDSYWEELDAQ